MRPEEVEKKIKEDIPMPTIQVIPYHSFVILCTICNECSMVFVEIIYWTKLDQQKTQNIY